MTDADRAILDKLDPEQIEAYLEQRKRAEFLSYGCADGFERLPMEQDLTTLILCEGCWVWRDASGSIRRAFGYLDAPLWSQARLYWATFDDLGKEIASGRLRYVPSAVPVDERALSNAAWLADIRAWLLTQPIERPTPA